MRKDPKAVVNGPVAEKIDDHHWELTFDLTNAKGEIIVTSSSFLGGTDRSAFAAGVLGTDAGFPENPTEYTSRHGHQVVGFGVRIPNTDWSVVARSVASW